MKVFSQKRTDFGAREIVGVDLHGELVFGENGLCGLPGDLSLHRS
jgi:hypothetical protein